MKIHCEWHGPGDSAFHSSPFADKTVCKQGCWSRGCLPESLMAVTAECAHGKFSFYMECQFKNTAHKNDCSGACLLVVVKTEKQHKHSKEKIYGKIN